MSAEGENIAAILCEARNFFEQLELLLKTAQAAMKKSKWEIATPKAVYYLGNTLYSRGWSPSAVYRLFLKEKGHHNQIRSFVSVLLNDYDEDVVLEEPLITGGWFDLGRPVIGGRWDYWYSVFHYYMRDRKDDGTWMEAKSDLWSDWKASDKPTFKYIRTFGWPLVKIKSTSDLQKNIIDPLLKDIEDHAKDKFGIFSA